VAEIIVGFKPQRESHGYERDRSEVLMERLRDLGWTDVVGPRGESGMGLYINTGSLNTISEVIAYYKNLTAVSGEHLLLPGDRLSIRVIGPRGGKAHYVVQREKHAMTAKELPPHVKQTMVKQGAVIIFGPTYLNATLGMQQYCKGQLVLSCERIDDLNIPCTLMRYCTMVFSHYLPDCKGKGVTQNDLEAWKSELLEDIVFRAATPLDNVPAEFIFQEPTEKRIVGDATTNEILLIVSWGPVESSHCVEVARSLERSYEKHGGYYMAGRNIEE